MALYNFFFNGKNHFYNCISLFVKMFYVFSSTPSNFTKNTLQPSPIILSQLQDFTAFIYFSSGSLWHFTILLLSMAQSLMHRWRSCSFISRSVMTSWTIKQIIWFSWFSSISPLSYSSSLESNKVFWNTLLTPIIDKLVKQVG